MQLNWRLGQYQNCGERLTTQTRGINRHSAAMQITDYRINGCRRRRTIWRRRAEQGILFDIPNEIVLKATTRANDEHKNVMLMRLRTRHVRTSAFNLNLASDHECLVLYRFKKRDIGRIAEMIDFLGVTIRNIYRCTPVQATCVFLHRLSAPVRWKELERRYVLFESQLS